MATSDAPESFEAVSAMDSMGLFKPKVVALVVTDSEEAGPNVMTASWWMLAGWNPPRYLLAVSHKTHTYELIEQNPEFVMAAPSTEMIDALTLCGMVSGRELDKIAHLGLETVPGREIDVPLLADAVGNIELSVVDSFEFEDCTYYFGSVEAAYVRAGGMDGRILSLDEDILAYMGSDWGGERKYRYYLDLDPENLARFPGDEVVESLPEDLRERYRD
ncbi:flavin reductase family protein [Salinirubellus salinus]|uniref:Flavin reductase family protein n=1 Tax=Salinirubellus salinus TaxID=1364945 RepID=A0A9E7R170_9EURY|nr:flavin reductase family protein [Salinirubellus salinus]UWM53394.1 flavin reductase family protein [Salinirubellus salinus]